jgi:hypothetical protein
LRPKPLLFLRGFLARTVPLQKPCVIPAACAFPPPHQAAGCFFVHEAANPGATLHRAYAFPIRSRCSGVFASAIAMTFAAGESRASASVTWSGDRRSALGASVSRWSASR